MALSSDLRRGGAGLYTALFGSHHEKLLEAASGEGARYAILKGNRDAKMVVKVPVVGTQRWELTDKMFVESDKIERIVDESYFGY